MTIMRRMAMIAVLGTLHISGSALAGEVSSEPILRLETAAHTAKIGSIDVDPEGRYLVTGSNDKTVRVWDLATGDLKRVLRPPAGTGEEGQIRQVAISPDGRTIVAGGYTGYEWARQLCIYFFDLSTGQMTERLCGPPNATTGLAWSDDGSRLAVTLGGDDGLRVYRSPGWREVGSDTDYGATIEGVDFDSRGRLVTSSFDGYIRLYDRRLNLISKVAAPAGKQPTCVEFSPAGDKVAVGYYDGTQVSVLAGDDLSLLHQPETGDVDNGNLAEVAWSWDGSTLYAGGKWSRGGRFLIRRWTGAGLGSVLDIPVASNTILDLAALPDGSMAYGTYDAAWGVVDDLGQQVHLRSAETADFGAPSSTWAGLLVAEDGSSVLFSFQAGGRSPGLFSFNEKSIVVNPEAIDGLHPPATEGLSITGWANTLEPKLDDVGLPLDVGERSRSLAIAPGGESFLIGTEWTLYHFNRRGEVLWKTRTSGATWSVNWAGDGRVVVAAHGDGTIRWYRASDGQEILAFFPHADQRRWVAWTPAGYYDSSVGGEELIGWHVNRGPAQAADFFPASRFRDRFYRPDVVSLILKTLDEDVAVRLANEAVGRRASTTSLEDLLPPVVTLLSPRDGTETSGGSIDLRVLVRSPAGHEITAVRALVDGRPAAATRGLQVVPEAGGETFELQVPIPDQDCRISVIAEAGPLVSEPVVVSLARANPREVDKPHLYVLSVGVSDYPAAHLRLDYAATDARAVAAVFEGQGGGLYEAVDIRLLTDADANWGDIVDGLDWLRAETTDKDVAVVFLAGHGIDRTGTWYYLPVDADPNSMTRTTLSENTLQESLATIPGKVLMFLDACHAGSLGGPTERGVTDVTGFVNELSSAENGVVVFTAATGWQASQESPEWENGAFTEALLEGLTGRADHSGSGRITITMLDLYLSERVRELTGGAQTPASQKPITIPDFPIAIPE